MAKGTCSVATCELAVRCSALCAKHYKVKLYWAKRDARPAARGTCVRCDGQFEQPKDRRPLTYCTDVCRSRAAAGRQKAVRQAARLVMYCMWCGVDIQHMRADAKFCSDACSNRCDYRDNRERVDASARRYVAENPGKVIAAGRRYRELNRQRIYANQKRWQRENLERHKAYQREYGRKYALANPDKARLSVSNRRAWKRYNGGGALKISERDWSRMLLIYGHRCAYCGGGAGEVLEIEHVVPLSRGGRHSIGNVVPACARCNQTKNDRLLVEWRNNIPRRVRRRVIAV